MTTIDLLAGLSDTELIARVKVLANDERRATVALIASLMEFDARRLYLREGCSSLFTYCTQVLHLSEHAAYGRIEAARAARRFPVLLDMLAQGALTLTAIGLLAPHLTVENHQHVLAAARHKKKRDVELLVATVRPKPAVPSVLRKLPEVKLAAPPTESTGADNLLAAVGNANVECTATTNVESPRRSATLAPLTPERYKLQVTLSAQTYGTLRRAQDLLRHAIPNGDLAAIVDRALATLVRELERTKFAETERPRKESSAEKRSRHVPAAVRRQVWKRDGGQCAFMGTEGRCTERGLLEFHHVVPYADGGESAVENLELRCRAHNAYEFEKWSGSLLAREGSPEFFYRTTRSGPSSVLLAVPSVNPSHLANERNGYCRARRTSPPNHLQLATLIAG